MKKLLIAIAAVAFLAAPAMAEVSGPVDVKLEILGYISMQGFNSPTITLTPDPIGGALTGLEKITGELYSNLPATSLSATAAVTPVGSVGTWSVSWGAVPNAAVIDGSCAGNPPKYLIATWVSVTVPPEQAPQVATLGATVVFTVSSS